MEISNTGKASLDGKVSELSSLTVYNKVVSALSSFSLHFHCIDFKHFTISNLKFYGDFKYW